MTINLPSPFAHRADSEVDLKGGVLYRSVSGLTFTNRVARNDAGSCVVMGPDYGWLRYESADDSPALLAICKDAARAVLAAEAKMQGAA